MQLLTALMVCKNFCLICLRAKLTKSGHALKVEKGQGTIEFAVVTTSLLIIVIALGLFWRLGDTGMLVNHALSSASHHLKEAAMGIVGDLFCC